MTVTIAQQDKFVDTVMIYHIHVDQHIVRIVCTLIILSVATQITPGHDLIMLTTWTSELLEVFHRIAPWDAFWWPAMSNLSFENQPCDNLVLSFTLQNRVPTSSKLWTEAVFFQIPVLSMACWLSMGPPGDMVSMPKRCGSLTRPWRFLRPSLRQCRDSKVCSAGFSPENRGSLKAVWKSFEKREISMYFIFLLFCKENTKNWRWIEHV